MPVDGQWGPRSQHFWNLYNQKRKTTSLVPDVAALVQKSFKQAEKQRRSALAARLLRKAQAEGAGHLPEFRRRVEEALRASRHGAPHVAPDLPDGRAGGGTRGPDARVQVARDTQIAVARERRRAEKVAAVARTKTPEKMSLNDIVALTVDPVTGSFNPTRPGDVRRVQRWLRAHGHGKLQVDGHFGTSTFAALRDSYFAALDQQKRHQEKRLTDVLYSSGVVKPGQNVLGVGVIPEPGELLKRLQRGDFTATITWSRLVELARDRGLEYQMYREGQFRDLDKKLFGGVAPPDFLTSAHDRYLRIVASGVVSPQGAQQLNLVETSKSFGELKSRLRELERSEKALRDHELHAAKKSVWWKGALDYTLVKPGEFFRSTIEEGIAGELNFLRHPLRPDDPAANKALAARGREWFAKNNPILNLAYQLVVDPVNLVPGAGVLGRAGVAGGLRLEKLGYAIARSGEMVPITGLRPLSKAGLVLTAPAKSGRLVHIGGSFAVDTVSQTSTGRALRYTASKATRLKSEAVAAARLQVNLSLRHGFRPQPLPAGMEKLPTWKHGQDFHAELDRVKSELAPKVEASLPALLRSLTASQGSLYVDVARRDLSNVGAMLLARVAEVFRVNEVQRLGIERASAAFERVSPSLVSTPEAVEAAQAAYRDIIFRAGSYIRGAHDPELSALLKPRVRRSLDRFEHVVFAEIQDSLERRALAADLKLFDETGKWAKRDSLVANQMRRMGADAFNPEREIEIPNSIYGRFFSSAEKHELIDDEVSTEVGRLKAWFGREVAAGRARPKTWLDQRVDEITTEAENAWTLTPNGWTDTRKVRLVPDIYARQLSHLYGKALAGEDPLLSLSDLPPEVQLAESPMDALDGELETELQQLAWTIAGGHGGGGPLANSHLDAMLDRYAPRGLDRTASGQFHDAIGEALDVLSRGYDEALPQALRNEWAVFQALAESQGALGRYTYRAIAGGLSLWIFATLPLRPGWGVRNVIDNTAKALIRGAHDPRVYGGAGAPGAVARSVFDNDLRAIRNIAEKIDGLFGTEVSAHFDSLVDTVWEHETEVLGRIFREHQVPVPEVVLEGARFNPMEVFGQRAPRPFQHEGSLEKIDPGLLARFKDGVWELMATRPENYAKRVLYRTTYRRELEAGATEKVAFERAWAEVEHTLFDYSKITVLEDNLKVIFPFIDFWRKNTAFWLGEFAGKPWLPAGIYHFETQLKDNLHADLPEWTRRYIRSDEIGDGIGKVPGLAWLGRSIASADVMNDPLNFFSFAPLYRTFKQENPLLPADRAGLPFISGLVDAMNDWGLSMNPLIRKPLELLGVFNYRAWQSVFPQTPVIQALTRKYLHDRFPDGLNIEAMIEDPIAEKIIGASATDLIAENFNEFVQMEMANQQLRGEPVSRAKAQHKIENYFLLQTLVGYFAGAYVRRMTPQDFWLYQLGDDLYHGSADYLELSPKEQKAYQLWKRRKIDRVEFDRYVSMVPLIQGYYGQGSYKAKERFKLEHPEVVPFVEPAWAGKGLVKSSFVGTAALVQSTEFTFKMLGLAEELRLPNDVRQAAESILVTPELKAFWAKNDTPAERRDKHLKLLYFSYLDRLNQTYFAIPEDDFDAKQGFLEQHPILAHWWQQNNSVSDDLKQIINSTNATLREAFFEKVENEGWDSADALLHEYPFMFEFTKAAKKVNPLTGDWIGGGSGGHGTTEHARDYLAAKSSLDAYFALPEAQRSAWLRSGSDAARLVRSYFAKYSHGRHGSTQHSRDYLAAKPYLDRYFKVLKARGSDGAWLFLHNDKDKKAAKIVLAYFRKYAHPNGSSQHAKDFVAAKKQLDHYFKLSPAARSKWLHGGSAGAAVVLAFFKKWGAMARYERIFRKSGLLKSSRPELNRRIQFWTRYWQLTPDERPGFVLEHADEYGVFIYGPLGTEHRQERENEYLRKAAALGVGKKAAMQVYVKPLLDFFFTLKSSSDKQMFLRANPELQYYLDTFARQSPTGDKKLDGLIEGYFKLPQDSQARSDYIHAHPAVQRYFDKHSTPADRAMRNLLEVYFGKHGSARREFGTSHPEIQAYFDKRKVERENEKVQAAAFDQADPRLAKFWAFAHRDIEVAGQTVADYLRRRHAATLTADGLSIRRDRSA